MWSKYAHAQSQFLEFETKCRLESLILPSSGSLKLTSGTHIIHFYSTFERLQHGQKGSQEINVHLE